MVPGLDPLQQQRRPQMGGIPDLAGDWAPSVRSLFSARMLIRLLDMAAVVVVLSGPQALVVWAQWAQY
jgi:hypothetical protein